MSFLSKIFAFTILIGGSISAIAQCETWIGKSIQTDAETAHSIYRQALKSNDFPVALEYWKIAYKHAPAADGKRDYHYTDGVELHKYLFSQETDPTKKEEYAATVIRLYDEAISCYQNKVLSPKADTDEARNQRIGYLYGRKAYDMFYTLNSSYEANKEAMDNCIKYAGDNAEYIIFDPYSRIIVWEFKEGIMAKEKAVSLYKKLTQIAEYNIANNEALAEGYEQAQASMDGNILQIERDIFDCEYFKEKYIPEYEDNRDDPQVLKRVLVTLKSQGCLETDPVVIKLSAEWAKYAVAENERIQAEFEANNPAAAAKAAYDEGNYNEALAKYKVAIDEETDNSKKATLLFAVASIEFRKLSQYNQARSTALQAARLRPNWGRPYILIGDMYGKTARSCGDSWNQRLAILAAIDKYSYAKSIDGSVTGEANDRLSNYNGSLPAKSDGFMRGVSEGQTASVGCWIGETVKLRFQ